MPDHSSSMLFRLLRTGECRQNPLDTRISAEI